MASVSQLCSPPFNIYYMGCCDDFLTCDIAFNAVMPLSRASTRGSYSRIGGVTNISLNGYGNAIIGRYGGCFEEGIWWVYDTGERCVVLERLAKVEG